MSTAFQIGSSFTGGYKRGKPVRSRRYLAFIRKQGSVVSGLGPCEAAHTGGHGAGQKSSDLSAIPLTRREHLEYGAAPREFAAIHGLDLAKLIAALNTKFQFEGGNY